MISGGAYNNGMKIYALIGACALLAASAAFLLLYNRLVRLRNRAVAAWHGAEVELKRRYDLIPLMAGTVRGYAAHEAAAFRLAAEARARGESAVTLGEHAEATASSSSAFAALYAVSEAYPDLKASEEFRKLQEELRHTEAVIANARKYYNACVMHYQNSRQRFPGSLLAGTFKRTFPEMEYLELGAERG